MEKEANNGIQKNAGSEKGKGKMCKVD